jgi:hypothetical protein
VTVQSSVPKVPVALSAPDALLRSEFASYAALQDIMRAQHEAVAAVAFRVATLHNRVEELREQYRSYRRLHLADPKDPFLRQPKPKERKPERTY